MITGEVERPVISSPSSLSTTSVTNISLPLRRIDSSVSLLRHKFTEILIQMEEQDGFEAIITKQDLEEWLDELEKVEKQIRDMRQHSKAKGD